MFLLTNLLEWGRAELHAHGISSAALDAEVLLCHVTGLSRTALFLSHQSAADAEVSKLYRQAIGKRASRMPVAYITGMREFMAIDFIVNSDTLIPRPDSEVMVEAAMHYMADRDGVYQILDLGTGSGCLGLSLLSVYQRSQATLLDQSEKALEVAKQNAVRLGLGHKVEFVQSNWCAALPPSKGYDIILCNPPYISHDAILMPDVSLYEPHTALFAPEDGYACYKEIASQLKGHMHPQSRAFFEVGQGQAPMVAEMFVRCGYEVLAIHNDLSGIARVVIVGLF